MDFKNSKYGDMIPAIPQYIPERDESAQGPGSEKYPFKMVTPHLRYRCHSIFANLPALTKRYTHQVWINPTDAVARGIKENDTVHVFNELGRIVIKAKITDHIMDGVIAVFEGTWFEPNAKGMDEGGCANVLTTDNPTPAGAFPYNSDYVQIEKQLPEFHPSEA